MSFEHEDVRDPLDALRAGWASLVPRELADEPSDAATLAVRAELRRAWRELEPPVVPRLPARLRRRAAVPARAWPAPLAAAVLIAMGTVLWRSGGPPVLPNSADQALPAGPRIASVTAERLELTSGNVRLVLLTGPTTSATGVDDRKEPR